MHLQSHLTLSWAVGSWLDERRDRSLVTWAGVLPDLDGISVLWGVDAFGRWHHVLSHNLLAAVVTASLAFGFARDRLRTAALAFLAFHVHLLADLMGSGTGWTVSYFYPFSDWYLDGFGWWELPSWQNLGITAAAVAFACWMGVRHGRTFIEACLPIRFDQVFCKLLRRTFGRRAGDAAT
jgi:inner membrane protein